MATNPTAVPARFPDEYGQTAATRSELFSWDEVASRIAAASNYWLATVSGDRRPHLRPVDGVLVGSTLAFGGSPGTRWVRHLELRSSVSVSLPDDDHAVILEGEAELIEDEALPISDAVAAANKQKYPHYFPGQNYVFHPFWVLSPRRVYAWSLTGFPAKATRFDFGT